MRKFSAPLIRITQSF